VSIVRWNLKEAGGKLLGRTETTSSGIYMLGKVAKQTKALNYSEAYGVNVADIWKERLRSYLGRSHERMETEYEIRLKQDLS
jgi:hypothetical protein